MFTKQLTYRFVDTNVSVRAKKVHFILTIDCTPLLKLISISLDSERLCITELTNFLMTP